MATTNEELGERIAEMVAHLDAATHRLLTDLRAFHDSGEWHRQGARTCPMWLSWRVGWSLGTARDHLRVALRLGELPIVDDALRTGMLSYSKVRAIVRVATPATEAALVEMARHATAAQLDRICGKYARVAQADAATEHERRTVVCHDLADGMVRIAATLPADEAALVLQALERVAKDGLPAVPAPLTDDAAVATVDDDGAATQASSSLECPGRPERERTVVTSPRVAMRAHGFDRADALVAISQAVLRGTSPDRAPTEVVVSVSAEALRAGAAAPDPVGVLGNGSYVSAEAARRLACDCGVITVHEDADGNPLSVGRKTRSIPTSIKRALLRRDRTCRFPGCTNRVFVEGHHIIHWASGGETALHNLVTVPHHHRFVHEAGYTVELRDGMPRFYDRHGREVREAPPPPRVDNLGWVALRSINADLDITADTNASLWDGSDADYDRTIDGLLRLDGLL